MDLATCIANCTHCHQTCVTAAAEWQGGEGGERTRLLRLILDCAEICQTSADFMLRRSDLHPLVCALCAEICRRCADACARIEGEPMQGCAEACRRCAKSCEEMGKLAA